MAVAPSRSEAREKFPMDIRTQLLEGDVDTLEKTAASIDAKLSRISWFAFGAFISFGSSAILLVFNLIGK